MIGSVILLGIGWYLMKKRKSKKVIHRVIKGIAADEEVGQNTEAVLQETLNIYTNSGTTFKPYERL